MGEIEAFAKEHVWKAPNGIFDLFFQKLVRHRSGVQRYCKWDVLRVYGHMPHISGAKP
jgi:hypothetical protein